MIRVGGKLMKKQILLTLLTLFLLTGCGKTPEAPAAIPESTAPAEPMPQEPPAQGQEPAPAFDYGPNPWTGTYFMANPDIEADPSVLDSVTMTLPEGVTRRRVSDRQLDFVKNGTQVGGIMLVDIPKDMLEQAAQSMENFDALADHLGKQVMPDIYPSEAHLSGGGKIKDTNYYLAVMIETEMRGSLCTQYLHRIYVGEQYCYDFWIDEAFWGDSGFGITGSLSADDIQPEQNEVEFAWSLEDRPLKKR